MKIKDIYFLHRLQLLKFKDCHNKEDLRIIEKILRSNEKSFQGTQSKFDEVTKSRSEGSAV
jgi:hypothetical protein